MASLGQWEKSFLSPCSQETKVSPLHEQEENAPQDCDCSKPPQTQPIAETSHLRKCCQAALYTVLGSGCQAGLAGPWENAFAWP